LQMIEGMNFGESPEQGLTRGRNFYHEGMGFAVTVLPGWRIQNAADSLTLVNAQRDAGLILQVAPPKAGGSHDEIIRNLVKPDQGNARRYAVNGLSATHFVGTRPTEQNQREAVELTVITGPNNANYVMIYAAKDAAVLQRAKAQMQEVEATFRPMSAADRAAARAWVLKTLPYPRGGFAELARSSPLTNAERQLRLINGVYAGGEPRPGQLVKVVQ
jgi:predicted Zn-dependent protease